MRSSTRQDFVLGSVLVSFGLSILLLAIAPMGLLAIASYIALGLLLGWSALRYRRAGWFTGLLFAILVVSMPAWVGGLIWLFDLMGLVPR